MVKKLKNKDKKAGIKNNPSKKLIKDEDEENSSVVMNKSKAKENNRAGMKPKYSDYATIEDTIKVDVKKTKKKITKGKNNSKIAKKYMR